MAAKIPRIYRMAVVPHRPGRRVVVLGLLALLFIGAVLGGYFAGRHTALLAMAGDSADSGSAARLLELVEENASMRDELAAYRGGGDVAREVEAQVSSENLGLQARIGELEKAVAWYRKVAVPDRNGQGLGIEQVALAGGGAKPWQVHFVLVRTGDTDGAVEGRLDGNVVAVGPSGRVELPLSGLLSPEAQQFRVRYVEERNLDLRLPAGLTPQRIDIVAVLTAPYQGRVEKSWQRQANTKSQEVTVNAGQGQR